MKRSDYQAGPPGEAALHRDGERWTLVFVRELRYPPDEVWKALTEPGALRQWSPFDPDRDLGRTGGVTLTMAGGDGSETFASSVRRAERPIVLEYTWDEDVLRWELEATPAGTRLTLSHTMADRGWIPQVTAGWHICLDVAERMLQGEPIGRIAGEQAKEHGWEALKDAYAARFDGSN